MCIRIEHYGRGVRIVNYCFPVKIDPDDLLDATEVAEVLGLAHRQAVTTYRTRYADFPEPLVRKASNKCVLWLRADIERWLAVHRNDGHRRGVGAQ
jgi:predicted DNA-binding transcriptional regulator AlpA